MRRSSCSFSKLAIALPQSSVVLLSMTRKASCIRAYAQRKPQRSRNSFLEMNSPPSSSVCALFLVRSSGATSLARLKALRYAGRNCLQIAPPLSLLLQCETSLILIQPSTSANEAIPLPLSSRVRHERARDERALSVFPDRNEKHELKVLKSSVRPTGRGLAGEDFPAPLAEAAVISASRAFFCSATVVNSRPISVPPSTSAFSR
mmetsp:Transcript_49467/g.149079  ORF Transcript_49467/g.149079 Transcript_49467/m.149079 type:complete len:205 (+) Transcript_49467:1240-1854(+)